MPEKRAIPGTIHAKPATPADGKASVNRPPASRAPISHGYFFHAVKRAEIEGNQAGVNSCELFKRSADTVALPNE